MPSKRGQALTKRLPTKISDDEADALRERVIPDWDPRAIVAEAVPDWPEEHRDQAAGIALVMWDRLIEHTVAERFHSPRNIKATLDKLDDALAQAQQALEALPEPIVRILEGYRPPTPEEMQAALQAASESPPPYLLGSPPFSGLPGLVGPARSLGALSPTPPSFEPLGGFGFTGHRKARIGIEAGEAPIEAIRGIRANIAGASEHLPKPRPGGREPIPDCVQVAVDRLRDLWTEATGTEPSLSYAKGQPRTQGPFLDLCDGLLLPLAKVAWLKLKSMEQPARRSLYGRK